jgi:hypothetical protein
MRANATAGILPMHLQSSYSNHRSSSITLDSICNSAFFFSGLWEPALKRNQSPYLLRLLINKFYGSSHGSLFNSRVRASHAGLAADLALSRTWVCHLVAVLREAGWITTECPRLPDGKQEISIFRPGPMLKRLLVMLIKSRQHHRVNDSKQKLPSTEDIVKAKAFFAGLQENLAAKMKMKT